MKPVLLGILWAVEPGWQHSQVGRSVWMYLWGPGPGTLAFIRQCHDCGKDSLQGLSGRSRVQWPAAKVQRPAATWPKVQRHLVSRMQMNKKIWWQRRRWQWKVSELRSQQSECYAKTETSKKKTHKDPFNNYW